jgi:hypothetical protein
MLGSKIPFPEVDLVILNDFFEDCCWRGYTSYQEGFGTRTFGEISVGRIWMAYRRCGWRPKALIQYRFYDGEKIVVEVRPRLMWSRQVDWFCQTYGILLLDQH